MWYRRPCMFSNLVPFSKHPRANPSAYARLNWCPDKAPGRNKETWLWRIRYPHNRTLLCTLDTVPWGLDYSYLGTAIFLHEIGRCRMVSLIVGEKTPCHIACNQWPYPRQTGSILSVAGCYDKFWWSGLLVPRRSGGFPVSVDAKRFYAFLPFFLLHFLLAQLGQHETFLH